MAEETKQEIQLQLVWAGNEDVAIVFANQFLGQVGQQDEIVLTFGQLTMPAFLGPPEEQQERFKDLPFVSIKPVVRLGLTKAGLDQLVDVLQETQKNYDQAQQQKTQRTKEGDEV